MQRGGSQEIPRPTNYGPGGSAPWVHLPQSARRFSLDEVRQAVAAFPAGEPFPVTHDEHREAAVLLALFERAGEAHLVFIKRPDSMPTHQGQIAFPGGTREVGDVDLVATALREAHEEIGLDSERVELIGGLDVIATIATPFVVAPFIGLVDVEPMLVPDHREVEALLVVALSELFDDAAFRAERWEIPPEVELFAPPERLVYFYELPGETIWGATARIVTDFLTRLAATRS